MAAKLISPKALRQAVGSNAVVLVFADWCGHCQTMKPVFEDVANELKRGAGGGDPDVSHVHFCKLDYAKHGHDIIAMSRDIKLNKMQHTVAQLRELVVSFLAYPELLQEGGGPLGFRAPKKGSLKGRF